MDGWKDASGRGQRGMNWFHFWAGIVMGVAAVLMLTIAANADTQEREEFVLGCPTPAHAQAFIEGEDTCYVFEDRHGFAPKGYLHPVEQVGEFTIYYVEWGNGASGIFTVK